LGFCLEHVEQAFDMLFDLRGQPDEYVEFSTDTLLRSAHNIRIEALARGVQGGIYSPNEARNMESLDSVKDGDEPRVQQQVVPLSAASQIEQTAKGPKIPGAPGAPGAPPAEGIPGTPSGEAQPSLPRPKPSAEKSDGHNIERRADRLLGFVERASRGLN
jgi:hypothetical protein